jgi:hypothetical protein
MMRTNVMPKLVSPCLWGYCTHGLECRGETLLQDIRANAGGLGRHLWMLLEASHSGQSLVIVSRKAHVARRKARSRIIRVHFQLVNMPSNKDQHLV